MRSCLASLHARTVISLPIILQAHFRGLILPSMYVAYVLGKGALAQKRLLQTHTIPLEIPLCYPSPGPALQLVLLDEGCIWTLTWIRQGAVPAATMAADSGQPAKNWSGCRTLSLWMLGFLPPLRLLCCQFLPSCSFLLSSLGLLYCYSGSCAAY